MSQYPTESAFPAPKVGLAVAGLVIAIVGLCIPGLGIVGLILGIVALTRGSGSGRPGYGIALSAIIVGAVSLVLSFLSLGILLPALGKARDSARQLKSSTQLRHIDMALMSYAADNKGWLPVDASAWQAQVQSYAVAPSDFVSPRAPDQSATDSYIYIPGFRVDRIDRPAQTIIAYENPRYVLHGLINVAYADGHVEAVPVRDFQRVLDASPKPPPPSRGTP